MNKDKWTPVMDATVDDWLLTSVITIEPPAYKPDTYYHIPELVQQITETGTDILSKIDKNHMYGRTIAIIADEFLNWSRPFDWGSFDKPIEPFIPNRFDLMERAKNDPKFECHQRIKAHKANPAKRKASKLARKARRNNK